jgi:diguanylate cyclase (GGDEF)-like protein/PAS domain S-box-containing protein
MQPPFRLSQIIAPGGAIILGLVLAWLGWPAPGRELVFGGLMLAVVIAALLYPAFGGGWPVLRLEFVIELTALLSFGPNPATLVAACGLVARALSSPAPWRPRLVHATAVLVAIRGAAATHQALGGTPSGLALPGDALAIAAAVLVYYLIMSVAIDVVLPRVMRRARPEGWRWWPARLLRESPVYFVGGSVATGLVAMMNRQAWDVMVLAAVPLYLAHRVYADHVWRLEQERRRAATLAQEVTEHRRTVVSLQRDAERLRLAAQVANDGLWEWDLSTQQFHVTGPWKILLGLPERAVIKSPAQWFDRVHPEDLAALRGALDAYLSGTSRRFQHDHRLRHEDGRYKSFQCRGVAVREGNGRAVRIAGSLTDTTDMAATQERLRHAVYLDPLTGLYNRAVFVDSLGQRLAEFQRRLGHDAFALLYLDLDRFKVVNDSLGHLVGDELLVAVSRRLETCLRQGDVLARLGGDEFAILLNGLQSDEQANVIAFRLQEALSRGFSIGGRDVFTSASIGIAFGAAQYTSPDEMMHDADTAMYQAKAHGKARHEVFDADMDARARDRLGLENDLRHAVDCEDIETHYQPIVSLASGMCVGFESLVRWTRNGKPVSPATFIPIAEELGLIDQIGTRVLEEACQAFATWQRMFPDAGLDCITVNASSRQLTQDTFLRVVKRAVEQAGLAPSALRIEITETALMTNPTEAAKVLNQLRDFGVKIYLDDFGTGYSSLSHLHNLPVDALKIDRSFVQSLSQPDRPAIVESILALARTLHTSVVAEGIETGMQARELERLGCTHAQGYLFSRAVSMSSAEQIVAAGRPLGPKSGDPLLSAAAC